jgi:hypothetical protein
MPSITVNAQVDIAAGTDTVWDVLTTAVLMIGDARMRHVGGTAVTGHGTG